MPTLTMLSGMLLDKDVTPHRQPDAKESTKPSKRSHVGDRAYSADKQHTA